jgi:truncated hemoglobin YjbI
METQHTRSLYDRLGGVYNIAVVVDDFIDRIMGDPRLNANPRVMNDFQQTLDAFAVPQPEQDELKAIVESTRESIVVAPLEATLLHSGCRSP